MCGLGQEMKSGISVAEAAAAEKQKIALRRKNLGLFGQ
jgi:hypothetical protein